MHTEQKVWCNWSLSQQNYLNYPTFTCRSSCGGPFLWGPSLAEHAEHA